MYTDPYFANKESREALLVYSLVYSAYSIGLIVCILTSTGHDKGLCAVFNKGGLEKPLKYVGISVVVGVLLAMSPLTGAIYMDIIAELLGFDTEGAAAATPEAAVSLENCMNAFGTSAECISLQIW